MSYRAHEVYQTRCIFCHGKEKGGVVEEKTILEMYLTIEKHESLCPKKPVGAKSSMIVMTQPHEYIPPNTTTGPQNSCQYKGCGKAKEVH